MSDIAFTDTHGTTVDMSGADGFDTNGRDEGITVNARTAGHYAQTIREDGAASIEVDGVKVDMRISEQIQRAYRDVSMKRFLKALLPIMMVVVVSVLIALAAVMAKDSSTKADRIVMLAVILPIFLIVLMLLFCFRHDRQLFIVISLAVCVLVGFIVGWLSAMNQHHHHKNS